MVRKITLKQQKFSQSDPVLISQISKKLQFDPVLIGSKLASEVIQSDPVLIRAHLCELVRSIIPKILEIASATFGFCRKFNC